jgi:hypothetical protein
MARPDQPERESLIEPEQEKRLVHFFERLFIRQEEISSSGASPTAEQITLAIQLQEEERRRTHERSMLREKHRHELELARHERQFELRKARVTFLPKVGIVFSITVLVGTALILFVLVRYDAKDQIGTVLGFLAGIIGGFAGGFATAKYGTSGRSGK